MAKLTRIVKKILVKGPTGQDAKKAESTSAPGVESLATRGLPQPTIDFSNLPIIDDEEFRLRSMERARRKALVTVSRKASGIAKGRSNQSTFKKNVVLPKLKGTAKATDAAAASALKPNDLSELTKGLIKAKEKKGKIATKQADASIGTKVIKTGAKADSRSKRKRETRKEMWRRKYDFKNEAKRLVESFQKEDTHGKALGNLSSMQNELASLEQVLKAVPASAGTTAKLTKKQQLRAKLRSKALLQAAMNSG